MGFSQVWPGGQQIRNVVSDGRPSPPGQGRSPTALVARPSHHIKGVVGVRWRRPCSMLWPGNQVDFQLTPAEFDRNATGIAPIPTGIPGCPPGFLGMADLATKVGGRSRSPPEQPEAQWGCARGSVAIARGPYRLWQSGGRAHGRQGGFAQLRACRRADSPHDGAAWPKNSLR